MTEKASSRLRVLALLVAVMFVALTARLWFLQVLAAPRYAEEARDNGRRVVFDDPLRGLIVDRNGETIVGNRGSLQVRVVPDEMGEDAEGVIVRLAELLDVPVAEISGALHDERYWSYQSRPVSEFTDERVAAYIAEHPELFPGVEARYASVRSYPLDRLAAHLLGYVGTIQKEDLESLQERGVKGYTQNDVIGRAGLEQIYERFLRGKKGQEVYVINSDNEVIRRLGGRSPVPGNDVHLTLDAGWQQIAEEELQAGLERARGQTDSEGRALRANAGAVIVLDADTGAIRAMASLPSFDPAWFQKGLTPIQQKYFQNDDLGPLNNRAYQLTYAPGSTFKPITSLITVEEGIASLGNYYPCTTVYVHGEDEENPFYNWRPINATISFADAIRQSCDTFFEAFGSEFFYRYLNDQLGPQPLQQALRKVWGFGSPTGLDLPGEASGSIPDAEYASAHPELYEDGRWQPFGDILLMIGAGNVYVTPMQMATAYAAIANGGRLCEPYLVERVTTPDDEALREPKPQCKHKLPYTQDQLGYMRSALASVVSGGTAACVFNGFPLSDVPVAGKTGTAERGTPTYQDTSWFASIVGPSGDPDYVVITMVEQGGFGSQTAAPITRSVIERIEGLGDLASPGCAVVEDR